MAEKLAKDIMNKEVITISQDASIEELSQLLLTNKISGVPVLDQEGQMVGIVTEGDIIVQDTDLHFPSYFKLLDSIIYLESLSKFKKSLKKHLATKVEDIMTAEVVSVDEDSTVNNVANIMTQKNINRVPVLGQDKKLVGIITRADIVKSMIKE
ncbi:MAG: CBS domain-containing protein [Actinomycetota bacterium]|nr:CBS domain-containing protein [Actinomycetota bacterium]